MNIEKMREGFESVFPRPKNVTWTNGEYRYFIDVPGAAMIDFIEFNSRWIGWQASRESLVIELPEALDAKPYACYEGGWNDMREESVDAIISAGLKVKS